MDLWLFAVSMAAAGLSTLLFVPWLIRSLQSSTLVGKDLNKPSHPTVPEMGGVAVILGFYVGVAVITVLAPDQALSGFSKFFFAALSAALGAGVVGLIDDMFHLRQTTKALLPFILALPLGAAVFTSGDVYLLGLNIGIFMVIAVPVGVTSAANAANMLEGFNGLGAGLMTIITTSLIHLSIIQGSTAGLFILFPLLGALLAFLWFNRFPARVFPGDSMTLFSGAAIACAAIISSPPLKLQGTLLFAPMIVEFGLKSRGRFRSENYSQVGADGRLAWDGPIESLSHAIMRWRRPTENELVMILLGAESMVAAFVLLVAWVGVV